MTTAVSLPVLASRFPGTTQLGIYTPIERLYVEKKRTWTSKTGYKKHEAPPEWGGVRNLAMVRPW